jgi:hypothetical protein
MPFASSCLPAPADEAPCPCRIQKCGSFRPTSQLAAQQCGPSRPRWSRGKGPRRSARFEARAVPPQKGSRGWIHAVGHRKQRLLGTPLRLAALSGAANLAVDDGRHKTSSWKPGNEAAAGPGRARNYGCSPHPSPTGPCWAAGPVARLSNWFYRFQGTFGRVDSCRPCIPS